MSWALVYYIESNILVGHWFLSCVYSLPSKVNMQGRIRVMANFRIVRIDKMRNLLVAVCVLILVISIVPPVLK